ncbi:hypothetical protein [Candidatus Bathycorpusculum sp.]|nr:hypothetical protein [Candidatus Termitimicrobium sp.]MCL2432597.1 hypothetical protein [Candidatus Termitimicrobium sp.]
MAKAGSYYSTRAIDVCNANAGFIKTGVKVVLVLLCGGALIGINLCLE